MNDDTILPFRLRVPGDDSIDASRIRSVKYDVMGRMRLHGSALLLEWSGYKSVDEVEGMSVRSYREPVPLGRVEVPLRRLASATLRAKWWRLRIELETHDLAAFNDMPTARPGMATLWIRWRDRGLAEQLLANVALESAEAALQAAENPPELPPGARE